VTEDVLALGHDGRRTFRSAGIRRTVVFRVVRSRGSGASRSRRGLALLLDWSFWLDVLLLIEVVRARLILDRRENDLTFSTFSSSDVGQKC